MGPGLGSEDLIRDFVNYNHIIAYLIFIIVKCLNINECHAFIIQSSVGLSHPQIDDFSNWLVLSYFLSLSSGCFHLSPLSQKPVSLLYGMVSINPTVVMKNIWETPWKTISLCIKVGKGLEIT